MKQIKQAFIPICMLILALFSQLLTADPCLKLQENACTVDLPFQFENEKIAETYPFAGLATYLNSVRYVVINNTGNVIDLDIDAEHTLSKGDWLGIVGREQAQFFKADDLKLSGTELTSSTSDTASYLDGKKSELAKIQSFEKLPYSHLWAPLAWLCRMLDTILSSLLSITGSAGFSIIILAALIKLALFPVMKKGLAAQNAAEAITAKLEPVLKDIKAKYDGEEAHNRIMQAHENLGVSPFYTMKPLMFTLVQLPFLVAAFNVLGEMPELNGQAFLWIGNLSYPDAIATTATTLPMIGNTINFLPVIMLLVSLLELPQSSNKTKTLAIALILFLLFYPFPAAMVLYWTASNSLQLLVKHLST